MSFLNIDFLSTPFDIDSISWFIENGHKSNRLRNGFKRAKEIAHVIKEYHDGTKKTTSRVKVRTL